MLKACSVMRLQICDEDGEVQQYVSEYKFAEFPYLKFDDEEKYREWVKNRLQDCVFGYDKPLYAFYIVNINKKWAIYFNIHHLLTDAIGTYYVTQYIADAIEEKIGNDIVEVIEDYDYYQWIKKEKIY